MLPLPSLSVVPRPEAPHRHRSLRALPAVRAAAVAAVAALVLAGCVAPKDQSTPGPDGAAAPAPEGGIEGFYEQDVDWEVCGPRECATVQAPLDWDDPEAGAIEIAISRLKASGAAADRVGSLLINPGGPGSSGLEFLEYAGSTFSDSVREVYDVVGFDPRGVGDSTAIDCGDDATVDAMLTADIPLEDQADVDQAKADLRAFAEGCLEATGPLLGEVDTVSAAKDMDLLRAVLGDETLSYAGFSYGTFLGATYADLFPDKVGRLLLDGAVDPSISNDDLVLEQAVGFEDALASYVEDCQAGAACPLSGSVEDGMRQIASLVERAEKQPLDAGEGYEVNGTLATYGIIVTLYDDASWSYLTQALEEALRQNTASILLQLANFYLDRTSDGEYSSNSMIAFTAINCLDYPTEDRDHAGMVEFGDEVAALAPTFGRGFAMAVGCEAWVVPPTGERKEIDAAGAAPILVVGTTGDPATPYEWSVSLAEQLDSGVLLTWEGEGHTAYGRANDCLTETVDAYLVDGTVPEDGKVC